jgi:magnesium chelatase subunit D
MTGRTPDQAHDAITAAALLARGTRGLGGVWLCARHGPVRERWLDGVVAMVRGPLVRLPVGADETRVFGGLDVAATLAAVRPISDAGLMARAAGGVLVVPQADRLSRSTAARLAAALDADPALTVLALDESEADDARASPVLTERLALHLHLDDLAADDLVWEGPNTRLHGAGTASPAVIEALAATAAAFGVPSDRASCAALQVARGIAQHNGHATIEPDDIATAARLVLVPRATRLPAPPDEEAPPEPPPPSTTREDADTSDPAEARDLADRVIEAARARLPPDVLERLAQPRMRRSAPDAGRSDTLRRSTSHGRPIGARPGDPRRGGRLDVMATLRAAVPWQKLREPRPSVIVAIRRDDLRVKRFAEPTAATTVFVVDASGSAALHRLAEVKGAVELLLADSYVRRDQIALIAFRGTTADVLLPPTRALARAKRSLAALPGGGGTPMATALETAQRLAERVRRHTSSVRLVLLTDGRANIDRAGKPGRAAAEADAIGAARRLAAMAIPTVLIDTSPRPEPMAQRLADAAGATYLPLPLADAAAISTAIRGTEARTVRRWSA